MPIKPTTRDAITQALREHGPMSVVEIMEATGFGRLQVNSCMTTARRDHPGRYFRITGYRRQVGVKGREIPIYAAGRGRDVPRPVFDRTETQRDYYLRNRARQATRRKATTGIYATPWAGLVPMERRGLQTA